MTRGVELWRSCSLPARVGIVVLLIGAVIVAGSVIYSFLLPVTG